jgi:uncharacterized protein (TIGR02466 family)
MNSSEPSNSVPVELQRIVSLANSGDLERAADLAESLRDETVARESWRILAAANANVQRFDAAMHAIERALAFGPNSQQLRLERALILEADGRANEAREEFERLANDAPDSPQLLAHVVRALRFAGEAAQAEARALAGLAHWPLDVPLHRLLAEIRWSAGDGARCTARLEREIAEHPEALQLRLVAADLLRTAGAPDAALTLLEEGLRRAPGAAAFETSIGVLLGELGRTREALAYLRSAVARLPGSAQMQRNLLPYLLGDDPAAALGIADALLRALPDDQHLIAYRNAALRLLGNPAYESVFDVARLVRTYRVSPPAGYADIGAFNSALARELEVLHRAERRPLAQSIRGGVQTERNLPIRNPVIRDFFAALDAPIRDYVRQLDARRAHPTDCRTRGGYRVAASWSVRLDAGGFHTSHVHPQGWISSAYYVEVPPDMGSADRAGWLAFGEVTPQVPGCGAHHHVMPEPGMLVLFPSFFWHGTVPFSRGKRRLTVAFDLLPAG